MVSGSQPDLLLVVSKVQAGADTLNALRFLTVLPV